MRSRPVSWSLCTLFALAASLVPALAVRADTTPQRLQALTVSFWPEYDQPETLVILHGQLPSGANVPAHLVFRVPAASGGPSSTAAIDNNGTFRYIRPQLSQEGDAIVVAYDAPSSAFQLEYYEPSLQKDGTTHALEVVYRADYAVDQLTLEFKEPFGASAVTLDPAAETPVKGDDGLAVHTLNVGPVTAGQEVKWKITYTRADARLSVAALGLPTPSAATYDGAQAATSGGTPSWVMWAIIAALSLVALVLVIGLILVVRAQRRAGYAAPTGGDNDASGRPTRQGGPRPVQVARGRYCHQCGGPLGKDDVFCRRCGTKRRGA